MTRTSQIFISYSSADTSISESMEKRGASAGFKIWRDKSRIEKDWSREIAKALLQCDIICLIWTENADRSKWVKHEYLTARALGKRIIPCILPGGPELPKPLYKLHGIQFVDVDSAILQFVSQATIDQTERGVAGIEVFTCEQR